MIDSTPLGAVVDECAAWTAELVVEGYGGGEGEQALQDALSEAGECSGAVALEREYVLAGPEDRLDALSDGREVWSFSRLVLAAGSEDGGVQVTDLVGEPGTGVALIPDHDLPATTACACEQLQGD